VSSELHTIVADRLRTDRQQYTRNRRAVIDVLDASDRPLTLQQILERRHDLAQSSAYRNLTVLETAGVVNRVLSSDDFSRYELAEDLAGHHHHMICSTCGSVADFTVSESLESTLTAALEHAAVEAGFLTEHHRLDLVGHCLSCT